MISVLLITLVLVLGCVWMHAQMLLWLRGHTVVWCRNPIVKLAFIVFMLLVTHIVEIFLFAVVFWSLIVGHGDFGGLEGSRIARPGTATFEEVVYFSFATYTTVGYGDVTPVGGLTILAQVEALTGLLLVGCSASLVFTFLQEFLAHQRKSNE